MTAQLAPREILLETFPPSFIFVLHFSVWNLSSVVQDFVIAEKIVRVQSNIRRGAMSDLLSRP